MRRVVLVLFALIAACNRQPAKEQFDLGVKYQNGDGVPKDSVQAAEWYTKAAKQHYAPAEFNLAVMYQSGDGVHKDANQAAYWYAQAAEHGDTEAPAIL